MEEVIYKILIGVATAACIGLGVHAGKLRDTIRDLVNDKIRDGEDFERLESDFKEFKKNVNNDLDALEKESSDLKDRFVKDQIERKDLVAFAASVETKIKAEMRPFMAEVAEQRRQDTERITNVISGLEKAMTKQNTILEFVLKDLAEMKGQFKNV